MNRKSGNRRHENSIKEKEDNRERGIRRENNEKEIRNIVNTKAVQHGKRIIKKQRK